LWPFIDHGPEGERKAIRDCSSVGSSETPGDSHALDKCGGNYYSATAGRWENNDPSDGKDVQLSAAEDSRGTVDDRFTTHIIPGSLSNPG
jgi:hypothetical protein